MNYPAASCEVSNPHLRTAMAPPVWRGGCSCILCMSCMRTLEQAQLDVLARQLLLAFFTALLPNIFANDFCIPVTAYGTDARAFRPKLATPQTLFDGWDAVKDLTARETFDHLANLGRARARHRLHQKMDLIFVGTNLSKGYCIPFGDVEADVFAHGVDFCVKDDPSIRRRTHDRVNQGRDVVPFMPRVAHASDNNTAEKAEASLEESDPKD